PRAGRLSRPPGGGRPGHAEVLWVRLGPAPWEALALPGVRRGRAVAIVRAGLLGGGGGLARPAPGPLRAARWPPARERLPGAARRRLLPLEVRSGAARRGSGLPAAGGTARPRPRRLRPGRGRVPGPAAHPGPRELPPQQRPRGVRPRGRARPPRRL